MAQTVFKRGDNSQAANYVPISLMHLQILEHVIRSEVAANLHQDLHSRDLSLANTLLEEEEFCFIRPIFKTMHTLYPWDVKQFRTNTNLKITANVVIMYNN